MYISFSMEVEILKYIFLCFSKRVLIGSPGINLGIFFHAGTDLAHRILSLGLNKSLCAKSASNCLPEAVLPRSAGPPTPENFEKYLLLDGLRATSR